MKKLDKMLNGIKKHGVDGAIKKQLGQWLEAPVAQVEKIEGGVEKYGLEGAVVQQLDAWLSPEEQGKREAEERELREREEQQKKAAAEERVREELRRKVEAEERELREREELQKVLEISAAQAKEREELRRKAEAEERDLCEREEQQKKVAAEKSLPKKVPFKDFMRKFLERDRNLDDDKAFAALKIVDAEGVDNSMLEQQLRGLNDPMINQHVSEWFATDIIGEVPDL